MCPISKLTWTSVLPELSNVRVQAPCPCLQAQHLNLPITPRRVSRWQLMRSALMNQDWLRPKEEVSCRRWMRRFQTSQTKWKKRKNLSANSYLLVIFLKGRLEQSQTQSEVASKASISTFPKPQAILKWKHKSPCTLRTNTCKIQAVFSWSVRMMFRGRLSIVRKMNECTEINRQEMKTSGLIWKHLLIKTSSQKNLKSTSLRLSVQTNLHSKWRTTSNIGKKRLGSHWTRYQTHSSQQ